MINRIIQEFIHPDGLVREYKFRIGKSLASALTGFIAGTLGATFYFWYIFKNLLPTYCQ